MRALRTIKLLREYLVDRCSPDNETEFLRVFDMTFDNMSCGMLSSLKELQVEPSVVIKKDSFNTKRYTVLMNKCLCKECGGKEVYWKPYEDMIEKMNVPTDIKEWLDNTLSMYGFYEKKIHSYFSCDFGNPQNIRYKSYFESQHHDSQLMPFYQHMGSNLRVKPDIVSAEWTSRNEQSSRVYNAINVLPDKLNSFLNSWFTTKNDDDKSKKVKLIYSVIGKVYCLDAVHIYQTKSNTKRVLFCLKCKCPQFSRETVPTESYVKRIIPYLEELSKIYGWSDELIRWANKAKNDELSWVGFNQDLDDLEMVIYYNDLAFLRRKESDFTSFSKVAGNNIIGQYSLTDKSWQSSTILEHILDITKSKPQVYKYLHELIDLNGLNNTIWMTKFDSDGNVKSNHVGINHNDKNIYALTKKILGLDNLPFSSDYMYYFLNLDSNTKTGKRISLVYQEAAINKFPNGSIYDYDGEQTYPKLCYKVLPGGNTNNENELKFNGNLEKIIENEPLISESIKNSIYFVISENADRNHLSFVFLNMDYDITLRVLKKNNNIIAKYLSKRKENYMNNNFNYGLHFKVNENIQLEDMYLFGTL
jgi:hypothetical protein